MRKFFITVSVLVFLGFYSGEVQSQQDAQYTQYMYNTLSVNPAYAGSRDVFSIMGLYRTQWVGLDGAPRTFTISGHSPIGERVGLGVNITRDEIFITNETYIDVDFSYTIPVSDRGQLAFGLKGGAHLLDIDSNRLNTGPYDQNDFDTSINIDNKFSPQVGLGTYYYTPKFYFGFSVPNLLETKHFDKSVVDSGSIATAKEKLHFYAMSGMVFDLSSDLKFKPAVLFKAVEGAPLQADLTANFLLFEKLTLGAAYRWSAAVSALIGFQASDQILIGFAYDYETTELNKYNNGSFEIFLRYELFKREERLLSPRFF